MKHIFLLLLAFLSISVYADKYDELILQMRDKAPNVAFYNYQQYQKENPQVGNVYYQLGRISYDYLRKVNPLYDVKAFRYHAYNAKLYYGNCLYFASDGDLKKYSAYYTDIAWGKKPSKKTLEEHIRPILTDIAAITEAGNKLNASFAHLLMQYEHCMQLYLALNTKFNSFNDALLLATADDLDMMRELRTISDSIPAYIATFKGALDNYKIRGYNPTFEIVPIELFRIDALCSVNFLANKVVLYDFGAWVRQFEARRNTHVIPLLDEIKRAYEAQVNNIQSQAAVSLINALYQLDPIAYPAMVLQIYNVHNQVMVNHATFAETSADKRLVMLYDMQLALKTLDEQYARLQTITDADMQRYAAFTERYFSEIMPYEALSSAVHAADSVYNILLQAYCTQVEPTMLNETNVIRVDCGAGQQATVRYQPSAKRNQLTIEAAGRIVVKTNVDVNASPKAMFYLQDADQLILAHDVLDKATQVWQTQLAIYDIPNKQLIEWIALPQVDSVAHITTFEKGHAIFAKDATSQGVTLYTVNALDKITRRSVLDKAAKIVRVAHYNVDAFVVYLLVNDAPQILLVSKE